MRRRRSGPVRIGRAVAVTAGVVVALASGACSARSEGGSPAHRDGCITDFHPDTDYFPDKSTVVDATNFTITYHNSYQMLTVKRPYPGGNPESYVLVRCGAPDPQLTGDLAHAPRVSVPVTAVYSASTTHLGLLGELGETGVVTGVASAANIVNPQVRQRVNAGEIVGYAPGQQVNVEAVIAHQPDVLITGGFDDPSYPKLRDAGIAVLADAEWLEATPLGRAEWVKVMAALTGTEKKAGEIYQSIRTDYRNVAARAAGAPRIEVLAGSMYQGTWSMPAGGAYAGRLMREAGGSYPWADDNSTGSLQLNFESVYARAGRAPRWLVTSDWKTLDDVLAADARYGELAAVRAGQVWSAGSDYWERGVARPDLVLADLIAILHPQLQPDHPFTFYRQVTAP